MKKVSELKSTMKVSLQDVEYSKPHTEFELKQMSTKKLLCIIKDMGLRVPEGINIYNPAHFYDIVNFIIKNQ